jgi:hypothetical protein
LAAEAEPEVEKQAFAAVVVCCQAMQQLVVVELGYVVVPPLAV